MKRRASSVFHLCLERLGSSPARTYSDRARLCSSPGTCVMRDMRGCGHGGAGVGGRRGPRARLSHCPLTLQAFVAHSDVTVSLSRHRLGPAKARPESVTQPSLPASGKMVAARQLLCRSRSSRSSESRGAGLASTHARCVEQHRRGHSVRVVLKSIFRRHSNRRTRCVEQHEPVLNPVTCARARVVLNAKSSVLVGHP